MRLPLSEYDDVEFKVILREPFVVTLPERHPAAAAPVVDLAELAAEPFIFVPRRVEPGFHDRCIALCQSYGFSPNIVEEGTGPTAICGMVATGLGITLSPASILARPGPASSSASSTGRASSSSWRWRSGATSRRPRSLGSWRRSTRSLPSVLGPSSRAEHARDRLLLGQPPP